MGFGLRRGIISSGALDALPNPTYSASTANLNGTSQYFTGGADSSLHPSSFSYAAWVKGATFDSDTVMRQQSGSGQDTALMAGWTGLNAAYNKKAVFGLYSGSTWTGQLAVGTTDLDDSAWHLLVGTYNDSTKLTKVYVDAVEEASITIATPARNAGANLYLGRYPGSAVEYLTGGLSFSGLFDTALTSTQITALYNLGNALCFDAMPTSLTDDLVSYWHLADFTGHTTDELTDQTANTNNLTNVGTPFTGTGLTVECT